MFLAQNGFIVYAGSRTPDKIENLHTNLYPIKLDLTNYEQIKSSIDMIYEKHGRLDVLINNAGYGLISSVEYGNEEEMKKQFDINIFSIFRVCKATIPYMKNKKEGSVIINIGSYFGKVSFPLFAFYSASKFALEGLTDALYYELKALDIRVHSVLPGFTKSSFTNLNLKKNLYSDEEDNTYRDIWDNVPKLMENISNGTEPIMVAKTILETINNSQADKRVYVEKLSLKPNVLKDELTEDEQMVYRFYNLEIESMNIDKVALKIAMDAKEILLNNYIDSPKLEQLAHLCATNKTKLNLSFKKVYKMTIANYIKKLRLEKAKILLLEGHLSIGEVSKSVGYQHQGNFSKLFFDYYGVYPKEILKG